MEQKTGRLWLQMVVMFGAPLVAVTGFACLVSGRFQDPYWPAFAISIATATVFAVLMEVCERRLNKRMMMRHVLLCSLLAVAGGACVWLLVQDRKPIPSIASTQPIATADTSRTVYITTSGKKYHADGCKWLSKSRIATTLAKAKAEGLEPCRTCGGG